MRDRRVSSHPLARENDVEISRSVLVPYSAEAMFDLIEQAERYPSFLPWCTAAEILERNDDWVAARLQISYAKSAVRDAHAQSQTPP